ncbi:MAG: AMP-binding protein [Burkholderiales bacterium]|nr:AMP-binding protein [Burkholderiales bacterium]
MSMPLTLSALLERHVAERPNQIAFIEGERQVSFAEFDRLCNRAATWLTAQDIGPGDRVAVWLVNRVDWMALLFALGRSGAVMMSVNTRFRAAELEHVLACSAARLLVIQLNFRKIEFEAVLREVDCATVPALERIAVLDGGTDLPAAILGKPTVALSLAGDSPATPAALPDRSSPDALAILFTTSGTTKGPKLVMHVQRAIALHAQRVGHAYGFDAPGAGTLGGLPFCGTFGLVAALATFAAGAPLVVMDAFDAPRASELIRQHRLTHVFGTEEMLRRLLEANPEPGPFPSARLFGFVHARELAQEACARGLPIVGLYGSSEVQALFSRQPLDLPFDERVLGGGKPASPDAEVRVRDVSSGELLPPGASGELEIRAPTNFIGYLDNPEATAKVIDSAGFFRTGDVGRLRGDGSFIFETRTGDALRLGGFLVSPVEIEEVIRQVPGVADAQVVAVEIENKLRCVAFVLSRADAAVTDSEVTAWVKARMADYKVPARVWFVDAYPVTHSANGDKIQRAKLREMAAQRLTEA